MTDDNVILRLIEHESQRLDRYERRLQGIEDRQDAVGRLEEKVDLMVGAFSDARRAVYALIGTVVAASAVVLLIPGSP